MIRFLLILSLLSPLSAQTTLKKLTIKKGSVATKANTYGGGPWISNVIVNPSPTTVVVTFRTDVAGSTQLTYGVDPTYGTTTPETDTSPRVTSHSVSLSGLTACSTYHFKALSKNAGLVQGSSSDMTIYTTGCTALASPVPAACFPYDPNQVSHVHTTSDIASVRSSAVYDIWRVTHVLPTRQPDTVTLNMGSVPYLNTSGWTNFSNIDKLGINVEGGFYSEVVLVKPTTPNNRLVVISQGHCITGGLADNLNDIGVGPMIQQLIADGFYVLGIQLPGCGANTPSAGGDAATWHNNTFPGLESSTYNPLKVFLEPVAVALNYTSSNYSFTDVSMIGISGGGWLTTIYPALDTRITKTFPVSGSYPHGLRKTSCSSPSFPEGDYEQGDQTYGSGVPLDLYLRIMSYEDAYLISSSQSRKQVQMLRTSDPCCFAGVRYQTYESTINNYGLYLGGIGFQVYNDTSSTTHEISPAQRTRINTELGY